MSDSSRTLTAALASILAMGMLAGCAAPAAEPVAAAPAPAPAAPSPGPGKSALPTTGS